MGGPHLTEKHGNKLVPTAETFGVFFSFMGANNPLKIGSIYEFQHLGKKTGWWYHRNAPPDV
jgi:hypothetical protein